MIFESRWEEGAEERLLSLAVKTFIAWWWEVFLRLARSLATTTKGRNSFEVPKGSLNRRETYRAVCLISEVFRKIYHSIRIRVRGRSL